jgi:dTDP-glucose 4,6-dehydratase
MKNVLVTGGAGFIGSNFICYLLGSQPDLVIYNLDLLTYAGSLENLKDLPNSDRYNFIEGDICDRDLVKKVLSENDIDLVVHFAAETHVDRSILGPEAFIRTNIQGTFVLLECLRDYWKTDSGKIRLDVHFHHISTDEVYGTLSPEAPAFSEDNQISPNSPYAASKAASDHLVRSYFHTYGLPITITNCSNNYGPNQFPEKLIPLMILNAIDGKPLPIYGDGQQIRDWLYVEDHCRAIWTVIQDGKPGETYNVGGENQPTNMEIVQEICRILDRDLPDSQYVPHDHLIEYVTDRPGHDRRYAMNINKIKAEVDWKPKVNLKDGLELTVAWYMENSDWVKKIRDQQEYQSWMKNNYHDRSVS